MSFKSFSAYLLLASLTGAAQAGTIEVTSSSDPFSHVNSLGDITFDGISTTHTFPGTSINYGSILAYRRKQTDRHFALPDHRAAIGRLFLL